MSSLDVGLQITYCCGEESVLWDDCESYRAFKKRNSVFYITSSKVRFKRLDLRFLEIGVLRVIFTKRDPEFPGISGQVEELKTRALGICSACQGIIWCNKEP
eukprot:sb/3478304/